MAWISITAVLLMLVLSISYRLAHFNDQPSYGATFIVSYAKELGLDWQQAYLATLDDLGFSKMRLVSYWDEQEPSRERYNFEDLDWQMNEAAGRGVKVTLAIGLRQPRWPECREPQWAKSLNGEAWQQALANYIDMVVRRYQDHPALGSWQLENEFGNKDFGKFCRDTDHARLYDEYRLVKAADDRPNLIMNVSNQAGLPLRLPHADKYGFSLYRRVYEGRWLKRYITHPVPAWWHSFRAGFIEFILQKPVIVHELQAEPWVKSGEIANTPIEEQLQTMSPAQLRANLDFARQTGIPERYLWGAEWWYWQKTVHNNDTYWQIIKESQKR